MSTPWRPLVGVGVLPWWVRLRDVLLTLGVWVVLFWMMRHLRALLWLVVQVVTGAPPDLQGLVFRPRWDIFLPFAATAGILMAAVVLIAGLRRRRLRAQPRDYADAVLDRAAHAARFGLSLPQLDELRSGPIRSVRFEGVGRIAAVAPPGRDEPQAPPATGT